jgi:GT2 family glycosyltransferase
VTNKVVLLRAEPGRTLAEAITGWLSGRGPAIAVVSAGPGLPGSVPEDALVELLSGPFGIGAVVPVAPDDGPGFRMDVRCEDPPLVAVSAEALSGFAPSGKGAGPAYLLREVLKHVRSAALRTVCEPSWRAEEDNRHVPLPAGPRRWAERDEDCPTRVLVVTGNLPGLDVGTDGLSQLVTLLARCPATRVTLACADGFRAAELAGAYRRQGVEVVAGPEDWLAWSGDRRYHYSHVVVSDEGLTTRLWSLVRSTQPQAFAVLYSEGLPVRRYQARAARSQHAEGTETVAELAQAGLLRQLEGIEAAWCASEADASLLAGLGNGLRAVTLGLPLPPAGETKGFADREGVALVAADGFDIAADAEGPAIKTLLELVPAWRRRDMGLRVKVVSDWPTPGLAHLASHAGAEIVPTGGDLVGALAGARLAVAGADHGPASSWLPAALAAGTPWLETPGGLAGTDGPGRGWSSRLEPGPDGLAGTGPGAWYQRGWSLLTDEAAWSEAAGRLTELHKRLTAERQAKFVDALAGAGLDPPGGPLWPVERVVPRPARRPARPAPRPASVADPPAVFVPDSLPEDQRYELWHARRGPGNPEVVAAIGAEAATASYQPTISVLMPVHDTDPWMLEAAVESVRAQAYPNWELCLADDASQRPETLATIEAALRRDRRVKLTRLEEPSGISAATNTALGTATGEYVGFLDHDDLLKPHALAQVVRWLDADPGLDLIYSDEDKLDPKGRMTEARWKPDWSPNLLLCQNYVCHFLVMRRSLVERLGGLRADYDGSQDYDLVLRASEAVPPDRIAHIPDCLYSWRQHERSAASAGDNKPWAWMAAQRALGDWLRRREARGVPGGWTEEGAWFDVHRVRFRRLGEPKVSVIIPTRNGRHLLERCVESLTWKTVYNNFELVVVDNQSEDPGTLEFLATLPGRVLRYPHEFNYARQVNLAAAAVECDLLVFLNNDTEVMTADWLDRLIEQAMRPEVGAVGPRLYLPDGKVQHEGILVGMWRGHANSVEWGNWWRMGDLLRDVSAVTGACMATRPGVFFRVGGYDERLRVAYNDVDYCMRLHQAGYQVVYEPDARLYHAEGSTRGLVEDALDAPLFNERWRPRSSCDPYYNPNLNRNRLLFKVEP